MAPAYFAGRRPCFLLPARSPRSVPHRTCSASSVRLLLVTDSTSIRGGFRGAGHSELLERIQRLEREHAELQTRIEGEAALRRIVSEVTVAATAMTIMGSALEAFASAMRRPLKRGRFWGSRTRPPGITASRAMVRWSLHGARGLRANRARGR